MKVKITQINKYDKDKIGNVLKTKDGRLYTRLSIKTEEYHDNYLSGFLAEWNDKWKVGDIVKIKIKEVVGNAGQVYLNFSNYERIDELEERVAELEMEVKALKFGL